MAALKLLARKAPRKVALKVFGGSKAAHIPFSLPSSPLLQRLSVKVCINGIAWNGPMKRYVSVWLPHWPIERLRRHTPQAVPAAHPFALVEARAHGLIITAVNARAQREGISPGLALADARALLPSLLSAPAQMREDRQALLKLTAWCGRYGMARHTEGDDGLWIDISGVAHLFACADDPAESASLEVTSGGAAGRGLQVGAGKPHGRADGGCTPLFNFEHEAALLADLLARLARAGFTARAASASTHGAAYAMARYGTHQLATGRVMPPERTAQILRACPVEGLRLDADTIVLLKRLGLRRVGQLYDVPRDALARRFRDEGGKGRKKTSQARAQAACQNVLWRLDQALGRDRDVRVPLVEPPTFAVRQAFTDPLISHEGIEVAVAALCAALSQQLCARARGARRLALSLYRSDATSAHIALGISAASAAASHFVGLLKEKLPEIDAGFGIDLMVLRAPVTGPLVAAQKRLVVKEGGARRGVTAPCTSASTLATALVAASTPAVRAAPGPLGAAAAAARPGLPRAALAPRDQQHDEAACTNLIDRLSNRLGDNNVLYALDCEAHQPERAQRLRPLMQRSAVGADAPSTRERWARFKAPDLPRPGLLFTTPEPIAVLAQIPDGPPAWFTWRRVSRRARKAQGPERISPPWWLECATARGARTRDYFWIEDMFGARYWVYREGLYERDEEDEDRDEDAMNANPRWFMHGLQM